jgi:carbon-monoxide dehydrogenase large subunit
VELLKIVTLDDAGKIINPVLAMGQLHGGVAQGAGEALFEEVIYDEQGNLLTSTLYDYGFPSATELPSFDVNLMETPTNVNDLGAKGIGESGTIGVIPAIANAVADALEEFPNLSIDIPTTPVKLFKLLYEGEMAPMKFRSYGK